LSVVCWTLAVAAAVVTTAAFAGGGVLCEAGNRQACKPQTWVLAVGVVLTFGLGTTGALLWKPKPKRTARFPWEDPR
jgi:hypothetical protein